MTTYYMVELSFPFPAQRNGFDEFYSKHISMLLSIEGFRSAQRFEAVNEAVAPLMAIYELDSPEVLTSAGYTSRAGPTSVSETYRPKMLNWDRNVLIGPELRLDVADDGWLLIIDRKAEDSAPLPAGVCAYLPAGLDRTVVERGIQLGTGPLPGLPDPQSREQSGWTVRLMRPLHGRRET